MATPPQLNEVSVPWLDSETIKTLPVFLIKLIRMLEDEELDMVEWDKSGTSFHILDAPRFCDNVLPHYFKHKNLNSFVRQLNFYGFRKLTGVGKSTLTQTMEASGDDLHFMHPKFVRGLPRQMFEIKRQTNPTKKLTAVSTNDKLAPADLDGQFVSIPQEEWLNTNNRLTELQSRQDELQETIQNMDRTQSVMIREIQILREMYKNQERCFNKLMSYFVGFMNPAKKVQRRPRPYVTESAADNFMVACRNNGDMLAHIQREFQEGLHISKQSVFEGADKNIPFEYYEPEFYDVDQDGLPLAPENQIVLRYPRTVLNVSPETTKREIPAPPQALGDSHLKPSTSYAPEETYIYSEQPPLEFLEQRTPPAPGESPNYFTKVEPIYRGPYNNDENDEEHQQEYTGDLMEFLDNVPLEEYANYEDGQHWEATTHAS